MITTKIENQLRNDIESIFKNEDFIEFLDWIVEEKYISTEIYYTGWCGYKSFNNKIDKYVKKLKQLGYKIKIIKDIYDENDGLYAQLNFIFK